MYNAVQTGAKTQSGGLKTGFTRPAYHGSRLGRVANWPINEAEATKATASPAEMRGFIRDVSVFIFARSRLSRTDEAP
jgi:hypothetical protein